MAYRNGNWINAKFAGACATCSSRIIRGDTIRYYPMTRRADCLRCGERKEIAAKPVFRPAGERVAVLGTRPA